MFVWGFGCLAPYLVCLLCCCLSALTQIFIACDLLGLQLLIETRTFSNGHRIAALGRPHDSLRITTPVTENTDADQRSWLIVVSDLIVNIPAVLLSGLVIRPLDALDLADHRQRWHFKAVAAHLVNE